MRGSVYKRCSCPLRKDARGRKMTCAKAHGSWSCKVDVPSLQPGCRRQTVKGGFATKREAEQVMAELVAKSARGPVIEPSRQPLGDYLTGWLDVVLPQRNAAAATKISRPATRDTPPQGAPRVFAIDVAASTLPQRLPPPSTTALPAANARSPTMNSTTDMKALRRTHQVEAEGGRGSSTSP